MGTVSVRHPAGGGLSKCEREACSISHSALTNQRAALGAGTNCRAASGHKASSGQGQEGGSPAAGWQVTPGKPFPAALPNQASLSSVDEIPGRAGPNLPPGDHNGPLPPLASFFRESHMSEGGCLDHPLVQQKAGLLLRGGEGGEDCPLGHAVAFCLPSRCCSGMAQWSPSPRSVVLGSAVTLPTDPAEASGAAFSESVL